jgi:hypothetical protein
MDDHINALCSESFGGLLCLGDEIDDIHKHSNAGQGSGSPGTNPRPSLGYPMGCLNPVLFRENKLGQSFELPAPLPLCIGPSTLEDRFLVFVHVDIPHGNEKSEDPRILTFIKDYP